MLKLNPTSLLSILLLVVLLPHCVLPTNPPEISPSPAPGSVADDYSFTDTPPGPPPITESPAPSPEKINKSVNAPDASDLPPVPTPADEAGPEAHDVPTPTPSPLQSAVREYKVADDDGEFSDDRSNEGSGKASSRGSEAGRTTGIVVGLMVTACFVGLGAFVYRKRQENIRRSRYRFSDDNDWL